MCEEEVSPAVYSGRVGSGLELSAETVSSSECVRTGGGGEVESPATAESVLGVLDFLRAWVKLRRQKGFLGSVLAVG